jgi:hypothetical protein
MSVVLAVTCIAIRGQSDLGDILGNVAGWAIEAAVRARQWVTRLHIVIKAPPLPTVRVVAERTIRPQAARMKLIRMAGSASQRRAFEQQRAMAFLARYDHMASEQRKSSDVVIEGLYSTPAGLAVALLAAAAKLPFVSIILPVARHAGRRQLVAIEIAGMARIALDLRMRVPQRKFRRLVVVEPNRAPLVLVVAGLAFGAVSSGVNILNPVAIDACGADPFVAFANVARAAEDGAMSTLKRELGLVMIERFDTLPCCLDMAIVT